MSTMLEQAIVDAKNLKEAAIKSAESAVIEKYAAEVKSAVTQILEQEEVPQPQTPEVENSALEDVPMAHMPGEEEEVVVVDLDDIIAAADTEDEDEEEFTLDREEIADEVGIDLDDEESPANRNDDELDLSEDDLVNMFKEMLVVDAITIALRLSDTS